MDRPVLYLMVGYPGAGKTTVAQLVARQTGAEHLWADLERHKMFSVPSHNETESQQLYEQLNGRAEKLLAEGRSVVFDTSFNHRRDRDLLRGIAARQGAETVVVWLTTPAGVARDRAVHSKVVRNGYEFSMTPQEFDRIAAHLEPPAKDEKVIKIDGIKFDRAAIVRLFR
ncbi:MAG TPA: ATP-binding protein [Candidatus Saccharimonadales bacterium]|nr:ATP-binding protein [Candidatus Saccharimonadales bacterium]